MFLKSTQVLKEDHRNVNNEIKIDIISSLEIVVVLNNIHVLFLFIFEILRLCNHLSVS